MCLTLLIASTAVAAYSAVAQADAQKAQAEYNAAVARNNAEIAAQNEADIIQRGMVARDLQRSRVNQTIGAARAAIAGSGLLLDDTDGTTVSQLTDDLMTAGQFDIMTLRANVDREARRARIQGSQFQAQAGLFDLQASSINPTLAGVAAAFGQASSFANMTPSSNSIFGPTTSPRPQPRPTDLIG